MGAAPELLEHFWADFALGNPRDVSQNQLHFLRNLFSFFHQHIGLECVKAQHIYSAYPGTYGNIAILTGEIFTITFEVVLYSKQVIKSCDIFFMMGQIQPTFTGLDQMCNDEFVIFFVNNTQTAISIPFNNFKIAKRNNFIRWDFVKSLHFGLFKECLRINYETPFNIFAIALVLFFDCCTTMLSSHSSPVPLE